MIKQGLNTHRFIVQKRSDIALIILLFNGNLVLPSRKVQFIKWYAQFLKGPAAKLPDTMKEQLSCLLTPFNEKMQPDSQAIPTIPKEPNLPSLDNNWLLGFTEAEGCFTISFLSNSVAFRTRFILAQKGDINVPILSKLLLLFNSGSLEAHSKKDNFVYILSGLKNLPNLYAYFDKCEFIGIKGISYRLFKEVNQRIMNQEHLNLETRKELVLIAKNINSTNRKIKS